MEKSVLHFYSPSTGGFYCTGLHAVWPDDAVSITAESHADLMLGQSQGAQIVPGEGGAPTLLWPPPPTPEEVLASIRAAATIDRETLCRALRSQGKLSDESAIEATAGRWPVEFNAVIQGMTPQQVWDAKVAWAGAITVRYQNPLLQAAALAFCQGDVAAATALLDQLFGIGGVT